MNRHKYIQILLTCTMLSGCSAQQISFVKEESAYESPPIEEQQEEKEEEIMMEQYWENEIFYTIADEKAVLSLFHYSVSGDDMTRERLDPALVYVQSVKEDNGYTSYTIHDTKRNRDIEFYIQTLLSDVVPQITGWMEDDNARISIDLKIADEILSYPVDAQNSRYGAYWMNRNFASIDGFSLISYIIVPEGQEDVVKGGQIKDTLNGYALVTTGFLNGNYDTVMNGNTADIREDEREELKLLAEGEPLVMLQKK